ncbi:MAG: carboxypeptidase regulatory-like domain-containing protein [Planctomycetes bacterium]|nr:carboxypeptidase regulatory-like domain-containing protein [Planctomycetota bacterium]MCH9724172.1 carboxypeptidase regulatory-like domain-containing protein [Planctomycetota bacterium]MCH9777955.1 carboxypeptidase regulatory-like domain-containing protein [Planctomycetota bacterium]MCH9792936.1 carboxypeptidase regulatory-like domain-containing protein [Planctomycetota bacterium]MDF1745779.1 carboxypeptidase regulatory-like domain-containing protein [Gimesia sp.]
MLQYRILLGCFVICLVGCGGGSTEPTLEVFPVNGTVTVDGEALQSVTVFFDPQEGTKGTGGGGVTDASGNFTILYRDDRQGVPQGNYKVLFSRLVQPDGSPIPQDATAADVGAVNSLPAKYNDPANTPVSAVIKATNEPFKFELKSK